jgi:LmbE family N-acetylglucosaminyl deacetylase
MKVMAFGPHPDDIELSCAGTLAKYKAQGHDVAIVCVTNGDVGSPTQPKEEIAEIRRKEAENSAAVIGAEFFWLNYSDEFLFNTPEVRLNFIETIRQFKPDIIIAPDKDNDYHPDHTTTGQIVWDTHAMTTVPNIKTQSKPCRKIADIYYIDTLAGINFIPEFYIDISDFWEKKKQMIQCHVSQADWLMNQYGASIVENAETQSKFRGYQASCKYAEAFKKARFFPETVKKEALL